MTVQIERAEAADRHEIFRLIEQNDLPLAGLEAHLTTALVAREEQRIVGCAALEVYATGEDKKIVGFYLGDWMARRGRYRANMTAGKALLVADPLQVPLSTVSAT